MRSCQAVHRGPPEIRQIDEIAFTACRSLELHQIAEGTDQRFDAIHATGVRPSPKIAKAHPG